MLKYAGLKGKPKEFSAAIGLTDEEFQVLLPTFEKSCRLVSQPKPKAAKKKKYKPAAEEKTEITKFFNKKFISRVRIAVQRSEKMSYY